MQARVTGTVLTSERFLTSMLSVLECRSRCDGPRSTAAASLMGQARDTGRRVLPILAYCGLDVCRNRSSSGVTFEKETIEKMKASIPSAARLTALVCDLQLASFDCDQATSTPAPTNNEKQLGIVPMRGPHHRAGFVPLGNYRMITNAAVMQITRLGEK
jgi:hypothetical protein